MDLSRSSFWVYIIITRRTWNIFYFSYLGLLSVDQGPGMWVFKNTRNWSAFSSFNLPTHLSSASIFWMNIVSALIQLWKRKGWGRKTFILSFKCLIIPALYFCYSTSLWCHWLLDVFFITIPYTMLIYRPQGNTFYGKLYMAN